MGGGLGSQVFEPVGRGPGSQVVEALGGQRERRGWYMAEIQTLAYYMYVCYRSRRGVGSVPLSESIASLSLETFAGAAAGPETEPAGGGSGAKEGGAVPAQ